MSVTKSPDLFSPFLLFTHVCIIHIYIRIFIETTTLSIKSIFCWFQTLNFFSFYFRSLEFSFCTKKEFKYFELYTTIHTTNKAKSFTCALSTKRYTNKIIITNHNLSAVIYVKRNGRQTWFEVVVVFSDSEIGFQMLHHFSATANIFLFSNWRRQRIIYVWLIHAFIILTKENQKLEKSYSKALVFVTYFGLVQFVFIHIHVDE